MDVLLPDWKRIVNRNVAELETFILGKEKPAFSAGS
jgi:hypothetical protein